MFTRGLVFLSLALSTPALAATELADQATGAVYVLSDAVDGKVLLTSKADGGTDAYVLSQDTCYATHPIYGVGAWQAVDGGWRVMVQGTQILSFKGPAPLQNPACVPQ
ncbi:hypothetical protein DK847_07140 [Aestuariivirga litoralis]|uniref:C-type lysozyme inhibitor domain-containing protein n=1 Tax=Aestuariivirga litoralis TaxID=2650924 RepID=A0A2W2BPR9_9HYPH|nr:hypothetical protein [Aestuariivirga litoralis]PZF78179.1 hypothetical protein DK847_07140 [Aestuariivirga litoralis]